MSTVLVTVEYTTNHCSSCAVPMHLPKSYFDARREDHKTFYCVNGHSQWFPHETDEERLRKKLHAADIEAERLRKVVVDRGKELEALKTRTAHGVCPCCHRTFKALAAHMKRKHPEAVK